MKTKKYNYIKSTLLLGLLVSVGVGCDREISEDAVLASSSKTAEVFIDGFSAGLDYGAFSNTLLTGFNVDTDVKYQGTSSMRFDVPNVGDPEGAYVGGIYIDGSGRDLSGYDALTFWAKGSQSGTINELGFGNDFGLNKYSVTLKNVALGTYWKKYIIPIPDASKLTNEKGLFWYAEGPENGKGYTFWIDEVKYEKLGTIAHPKSSILDGKDIVQAGLVKSKLQITGLTQTVNLSTGINQTVSIAPSYFTFLSSDTKIATVSESGLVSILAAGTVKITATLGGEEVSGSLTLNTVGFDTAPVPTLSSDKVISIFSNKYKNINVDYFNGYWQPYQTTESLILDFDGDNIINYTNFNFVGIDFNSSKVDATNMTYLHIDYYTTSPIVAPTALYVDLISAGSPNVRAGVKFDSTFLQSNKWNSLEIPLSVLSQKNAIFQIILNAPEQLMKNVYVDNVYFHN